VLRLSVETTGISQIQQTLALLTGKADKITAIAMSKAAASAKTRLGSAIFPQIQGGPAPWTTRGLRYWRADRDRLVAAVGWNYGDNSPTDIGFTPKGRGVPSGRYMGLLGRGGDRRPKSTELAMRRAGVIGGDQFITPNRDGVSLNAQGNLPGAEYRRILSRIKAAGGAGQGSTSNASNSRRSRAKRAQSDFFVRYGSMGEGAQYVARRIGPGPKGGTGRGSGNPGRPMTVGYRRGFVPALFVVDQPNYERKFNIYSLAWTEYQRAFPREFTKALAAEQARQAR
jgi:hypothetical protein